MTENETEPVAGAEPPARSSLKAWLADTREAIATPKTYELALPGFTNGDKRLIAVYRAPGEKVMQKVGRRNERQPEDQRNLLTACDVLTECCEDIIAVDGEERVSLGPWSAAMVRNFGIDSPDVTTPRRALLAIYCTDELRLRITKHFNQLIELVEEDAPGVVAEVGEGFAASTPAS